MEINRHQCHGIDVIKKTQKGFQGISGPKNPYFRPKSGVKTSNFHRFQWNAQPNMYQTTPNHP